MTTSRLCVDCGAYKSGQCSALNQPAPMARYVGACGAAGTLFRRPGRLRSLVARVWHRMFTRPVPMLQSLK